MQETVVGIASPLVPENIPAIEFFLQDINTPFWLWFFRCLAIAGFLAAAFVYQRRRGMKTRDAGNSLTARRGRRDSRKP